MNIIHYGEPIPLTKEEGMEKLEQIFTNIKNNISESELNSLKEEIKNINELQLLHLQG